ncbi:hypothetical protein CTA1_3198 [Colletotrichum tanaceti]|uniref:Uncharacterized protein n=1 Tax=Colletotrichum tanaceti TaxID=1306861 RepID=A0A4V6DID2_9PEZI|nr:hypothetical protein CTA1_3198 [Colletotrichum tanaceti]
MFRHGTTYRSNCDGIATQPSELCPAVVWKSVHTDQARQRPPFTQQLLKSDIAQETQASQCVKNDLASLLPASRQTTDDDLEAPALSPILDRADVEVDMRWTTDIQKWIDEEVDVDRLAAIHDLLWIVGWPRLPCPLHEQCLLSRDIMVTEKLDLHLVWTTNRIFIKPLPRFLLNPRF